MQTILILAYFIWSIYSGYKILNGRLEWLDRPRLLNRMVKVVAVVIVGIAVAVFYLIYLIVTFIVKMAKM